jgi:hypothetical protein
LAGVVTANPLSASQPVFCSKELFANTKIVIIVAPDESNIVTVPPAVEVTIIPWTLIVPPDPMATAVWLAATRVYLGAAL